MATYTDVTELRSVWRVPEEQVKPDQMQRAAKMAYNEVNAKLSGVYPVPFSSPYPPKIVDISDMMTKTIALMLSVKRGGIKIDEMDFNAGEIHLAMKWLEELRKAESDLPGYSRTYDEAYHTMEGYTPIFNVDGSLNHLPDTDLLEDIADERDS